MPFCDFMAFSHSDRMMILGLVPNVYYTLLAVLLHTGRYICDMCFYECMYVCMSVYVCLCMCVSVCVCMCVCVCVCV